MIDIREIIVREKLMFKIKSALSTFKIFKNAEADSKTQHTMKKFIEFL